VPRIPFEQLPDDARLWIFAASDPIGADGETDLLSTVDEWLTGWHAHGAPLHCAREWTESRFLAVGVDQHTEGASGCSIDALFRVLQGLEQSLGTRLLAGGRVFYRNDEGQVVCTERASFRRLPGIDDDTRVFDTTITSAGEYRRAFERALRDSWHRDLRLEAR
jgi:hypothetical protein